MYILLIHPSSHPPTPQCLDEHLNIILQHAAERRAVERAGAGKEAKEARQQQQAERSLGLVMLPGEHVVRVEVKKGRDSLEVV